MLKKQVAGMNIIYNICNWWKLYVRSVSVSGFFRRVRLDPIRIRFSKGWIRSGFSYKINRIFIPGKFGQVCTKFLFLSNLFYLKFEFGHQINIFFSSSTHSISVAPCSSLYSLCEMYTVVVRQWRTTCCRTTRTGSRCPGARASAEPRRRTR